MSRVSLCFLHVRIDSSRVSGDDFVYRKQPYIRRILYIRLKVHKIENFFGSDFEFCVISLLVMLKYSGFVKNNFLIRPLLGEIQLLRLVWD